VTAPVRVLVVDDEPLARSGMRRLLERDREIVVAGECADGRSAIDAIRSLAPDLVLLDIQMPEADGFEVIREVGPSQMPSVIFTTAFNQFAVRAFDVNALDYLVKPFDDHRFTAAIERAKRALATAHAGDLGRRLAALLKGATPEPQVESGPTANYPQRLVVRDQGKSLFVRVEELDWVEAADYYVKLHLGRQVLLLRETMAMMERKLDPARFVRVHRSAIVNLDRIREIQPYFHDEHVVILQDGTRVRLSRSRRVKLEALLGQRL
jgi:two-component system, LytTR family, response regulator